MSESRTHTCVSRRMVVGGGLAGVGAVCLAACASPDSEGPDDGDPQDGADGAAQEGGTEGADVSGAGTLAALDDIPIGGALAIEIDGEPYLLTRPSQDEVLGFSAVCTHEGCQVTPGEGDLVCPCHQSVFDLNDGSVLSGPAGSPLPSIEVEISGDDVVAA